MEVTVAERQGSGREAVAERSRRQTSDHRNTNWQRGRAWATSVLANAKSRVHQDTSCRARWHGGRVEVITRGDLLCEGIGEVSRGRSSDETCRKPGGAKGRRNQPVVALRSIVSRGKELPGRQQTVVRIPRHSARTRSVRAVKPRQTERGGNSRKTRMHRESTAKLEALRGR